MGNRFGSEIRIEVSVLTFAAPIARLCAGGTLILAVQDSYAP
ncbi:MAG: hypothetical protein Q8P82_02565 [bacterium]|nr:hypothetical protein [bacterium]